MERNWHTHKFQHRIFATIFSMCVVDGHAGYQYEGKGCSDRPSYGIVDFCKILSSQLMFYESAPNHVVTRSATRSDIEAPPVSQDMYCPLLWLAMIYSMLNFNVYIYIYSKIRLTHAICTMVISIILGPEASLQTNPLSSY